MTRDRGCARHRARALAAARRRSGLLIGSHIDTVIDAGKYDGPLGVVAGILAVRASRRARRRLAVRHRRAGLRRRGGLALSHDAGVAPRPAPACSTARRSRFPDRNGMTLGDAIKAYGKNAADIPQAAYDRGECRRLCRGAYRAGAGAGSARTSRSASSPGSSARAACGSWCSARRDMPAPCRCACATMRWPAPPK